jgi:hypothetical protein
LATNNSDGLQRQELWGDEILEKRHGEPPTEPGFFLHCRTGACREQAPAIEAKGRAILTALQYLWLGFLFFDLNAVNNKPFTYWET